MTTELAQQLGVASVAVVMLVAAVVALWKRDQAREDRYVALVERMATALEKASGIVPALEKIEKALERSP